MHRKIGRFVSRAAPVALAYMTGGTSAALMTGLRMASATSRPPPSFGPTVMPGAGGVPAGGFIRALGGAVGGIARGVVGLVRTATGKIRGVILQSGKFISRRNAVALAKRVGLDAAAVTLGISALELSEMVMDEVSRRRRRRGITARDLSTARRVNRQLACFARQVGVRRKARCAPPC